LAHVSTSRVPEQNQAMRKLSIEAASPESAKSSRRPLPGSDARFGEDADGVLVVTVPLADATETIAVLNALQQHLLQLGAAATRVELDGQGYTLEARAKRLEAFPPNLDARPAEFVVPAL
jgi:hypothetical protein